MRLGLEVRVAFNLLDGALARGHFKPPQSAHKRTPSRVAQTPGHGNVGAVLCSKCQMGLSERFTHGSPLWTFLKDHDPRHGLALPVVGTQRLLAWGLEVKTQSSSPCSAGP